MGCLSCNHHILHMKILEAEKIMGREDECFQLVCSSLFSRTDFSCTFNTATLNMSFLCNAFYDNINFMTFDDTLKAVIHLACAHACAHVSTNTLQ